MDKNNKEIVPTGSVTIYYKPKNISLYDGSLEVKKITDGQLENCSDDEIYSYLGEMYVYFEIDKSETIMFVCYGDPLILKEDDEIPDIEESTQEYDPPEMNITNGYKVSDISTSEAETKYNTSNQILIDGINHINDFCGMGLVIKEVETPILENGDFDIDNQELLNSVAGFIYLNKKEHVIEDFINPSNKNFEDTFGFDYKNCKGIFDVYYEALKAKGIVIDFDECELDKQWYSLTGERRYIVKNDNNIVKSYMEGVEYDNILSSKVYYVLDNDEMTNKKYNYIPYVNVRVMYENNGEIKQRACEYFIMILTEELVDKHLEVDFE